MSKATKLSTGDKFGKWTVLNTPPVRDNRGALWYECECECGTKKPLKASYLTSQNASSCRTCAQRSGARRIRAAHDPEMVSGSLFGPWTVVCPGPNDNVKKLTWLCRCKCGNEQYRSKKDLNSCRRRGDSSCTECRSYGAPKKPSDRAGQRFGLWEALEEDLSSTKRAWLCVCHGSTCGGHRAVVQTHNLLSGKSTRCRKCASAESSENLRSKVGVGDIFGPFRVTDANRDEKGCVSCECMKCGLKTQRPAYILKNHGSCGQCTRFEGMYQIDSIPVSVESLATESVTANMLYLRIRAEGVRKGGEIPLRVLSPGWKPPKRNHAK